jgi:XRE family aerobic/anaerobic benzoate catabolism transcriptional regulator
VTDQQIQAQTDTGLGRSGRQLPFDGVDIAGSEAEFLAELGERVRTSRMRCDLSRRELGRRSGISERYIAQIEAGKGNVSVVLLLRIALAIHCAQDGTD